MLIKMSPESVSRMIQSFISRTDKTPALDQIMSVIKGRCRKVLINGMDLKTFEGINWRGGMLPNIADNIIKSISLEHVDWIGG